MNDAIADLNSLVADSVTGQVPMRTTEELRDFFKNSPKHEYSVVLEEVMTSVVKIFATVGEGERRAMLSQLSSRARHGFLGYAADMAVLAVRRQSPTLIEQGLTAVVIEGASHDFRDSIVAIAKLYHSAAKLGMDAKKAFENAAGLADPGIVKTELNGFTLGLPRDRDLASLSWAEEITEDGFLYKQVLSSWLPPQGAPELAPTRPVETSQQISARLSRDQQMAMIGMAGTLAEMAIRMRSPKLVEQGLQGLALGGGAFDPSHRRSALAKLYHSALKLNMNAEVVFASAAQLAPPGDLKTEMSRFPLLAPEDRDLAAFNLEEQLTEKGFGYKKVPPKPL